MVKQNSAEFKLEAAKMVVDLHYSVVKAAQAMGVSLAALNRWVKKPRLEQQGKAPTGLPLTPEKIELSQMKKKLPNRAKSKPATIAQWSDFLEV